MIIFNFADDGERKDPLSLAGFGNGMEAGGLLAGNFTGGGRRRRRCGRRRRSSRLDFFAPNGLIDLIVHRREMRSQLVQLLAYFSASH